MISLRVAKTARGTHEGRGKIAAPVEAAGETSAAEQDRRDGPIDREIEDHEGRSACQRELDGLVLHELEVPQHVASEEGNEPGDREHRREAEEERPGALDVPG